MAKDPAALQLRLLQTVVEVAGEKNSTLVMPVPVELLRFFERMAPPDAAAVSSSNEEPEDLGDEEVAAAEAAIGHTVSPKLGTKAEPEAKALGDATVPAPVVPEIAVGEELPVTDR
jgi:hypothetical protein